MASSLPSFVLGYHGCDESVAEAVLSGRQTHLQHSRNSYDWLGSGVYFWENSTARALEYAQLRKKHPAKKSSRIKMPAVIGAVIDLGYCLDLMDSKYFGIMRDGSKILKDFLNELHLPVPMNMPLRGENDMILRTLDCSVINMVHRTRKRQGQQLFDTVRAAFIEGSPLYDGSSFRDKNHIQVCVCNLNCIKGYFRPLPEVLDGGEFVPADPLADG